MSKAAKRGRKDPGGGDYSPWDITIVLCNNSTVYFGVSTNGDPAHIQHCWIQYLASVGTTMEKRKYIAKILLELLGIESPLPPAVGGAGGQDPDGDAGAGAAA